MQRRIYSGWSEEETTQGDAALVALAVLIVVSGLLYYFLSL
jgi:hypothetical protein